MKKGPARLPRAKPFWKREKFTQLEGDPETKAGNRTEPPSEKVASHLPWLLLKKQGSPPPFWLYFDQHFGSQTCVFGGGGEVEFIPQSLTHPLLNRAWLPGAISTSAAPAPLPNRCEFYSSTPDFLFRSSLSIPWEKGGWGGHLRLKGHFCA